MSALDIPKAWTTLSAQYVEDDDGNVWKVADLIDRAKDLPVMEVPLAHLCIDRKIGSGNLKIREFVAHMKQAVDTDLDCPILLDELGNILDGTHRAIRALFEGRETIKAKRFPEDPPPSFTRP